MTAYIQNSLVMIVNMWNSPAATPNLRNMSFMAANLSSMTVNMQKLPVITAKDANSNFIHNISQKKLNSIMTHLKIHLIRAN